MKNFFTLMFLFFLNTGWARNYYFSSNSGDDSRTNVQAQSPSTPWKSLTKLNTVITTLLPGDSILLKRGETFYGSIIVKKSGTSAAPIVIGAYGSGNKPVVTSLATIANWVSKGNGIYESANAISGTRVKLVLFNGVQQELGRYPNSNAANGGFLTYESHYSTTSITDNELTSTINWTGADVVIRKRRWIIDRDSITAHSGTKITFKPSASYVYAPSDKFGYFIENSLKTLDKLGEWYYNRSTSKLSVYFGSNSPSSYNVQVPTSNDLIYCEKANYVVFDNLNIKGANSNTFNTRYGSYVSVTNCDLSFASTNGVNAFMAANFKVEGCTIDNCNTDGIDLGYAGDYATIRNNKILNTFTFAGMGTSGDGKGMAIHSNSSGAVIEYNEIRNTGFTAINFGGSNTTVKNNYIDKFCFLKDDGGGIYTFGGSGTSVPTVTNRKVIGNIVMNGVGAPNGAYNPWGVLVQGIYLDNGSMNVEVTGNTVYNVSDMAMLLNGVSNIKFSSNTFYAPITRHICFSESSSHPLIRNNSVSNNIFFTKSVTEEFILRKSQTSDINLFATISGNYYARLSDANTATIHTKVKAYDANAKFKDYSTPVRYEFNATKVAKTIALDATYADAKNVTYSGSITLQPYSSVVLVRTGAVTNVAPTVSITSPAANASFAAPASVTFNATATDANGTVSKVAFYNGTTLLGTDTTSPYSFTWKNVAAGNYTITAKATDNGSLVTTSAPVSISVYTPNVAPVVSITSPVANTSFAAPASVIISAAATDANGSVSKVDFYSNDTLIGTAASSPYTFTWRNVPAGKYSITAKATDNNLAVTASAAVAVSVFTPQATTILPTPDTLLSSLDTLTSSLDTLLSSTSKSSSGSDTLSPVADAFVRSGSYASVNYGKDMSLIVKGSTSFGYSRASYLKFSLDSLVGINSAKLRIYGHNIENTSNITISAYSINNDSWSENTITFNNVPTANLSPLSSAAVNNQWKYYEFDVTEFVKAQSAGDKIVSFLIKDSSNQNVQLAFNSKENSQNKPQLIIGTSEDSLALDTALIARRDTLANNTNIQDTTSLLNNVHVAQLRQNRLSRVEETTYSLKVFPNPAVSKIQITVEGSQVTNKKAQLSIINLAGIVVKTVDVTTDKTIEADVSSLSAGIYIATLREGNNIISKKFLKN